MRIFIICLFLFLSCNSQKSILTLKNNCNEGFFVFYRGAIQDKLSKELYLSFEDGFNDTLEIYLNGGFVKRDFYKTNPALGVAGGIKLNKLKRDHNILFIYNVTKNRCLELTIDYRYHIVEIDFADDKWGVTYSNDTKVIE